MKYLLTLSLLLNTCFAQRLQPPVIDKLTGDTSIGTERVTLYRKVAAGRAGEKLEALVYKSKGNTFLVLVGRTGKTDAFSFDEGNEVNLKLNNNSIVTLKNAAAVSPKVDVNPFGQYWNTIYVLNDDNIKTLLNSTVTYIRLNHSTGYFEYDVKDKMGDLIGKCVAAIK